MNRTLGALSLAAWAALLCLAAAADPVKITARDRCPVCGMFVAKFPDFAAQIVYRDGSYAVFDGAKDLFKYYFNISKYDPGKSSAGIAAIYVTGYYDLKYVDARKALYVSGSNVFGPMGKELIPFDKASDAGQFMADHHGQSVLSFDKVSPALLRTLE
jgi:copper chaperone NosL